MPSFHLPCTASLCCGEVTAARKRAFQVGGRAASEIRLSPKRGIGQRGSVKARCSGRRSLLSLFIECSPDAVFLLLSAERASRHLELFGKPRGHAFVETTVVGMTEASNCLLARANSYFCVFDWVGQFSRRASWLFFPSCPTWRVTHVCWQPHPVPASRSCSGSHSTGVS